MKPLVVAAAVALTATQLQLPQPAYAQTNQRIMEGMMQRQGGSSGAVQSEFECEFTQQNLYGMTAVLYMRVRPGEPGRRSYERVQLLSDGSMRLRGSIIPAQETVRDGNGQPKYSYSGARISAAIEGEDMTGMLINTPRLRRYLYADPDNVIFRFFSVEGGRSTDEQNLSCNRIG